MTSAMRYASSFYDFIVIEWTLKSRWVSGTMLMSPLSGEMLKAVCWIVGRKLAVRADESLERCGMFML
jgi:hypothetical protein